MAVILKLRCPDCAEAFKWPGDQKWPDFCPNCRAALSTGTDEVCMPFISTNGKSRSIDKVYSDMEKGSDARAQIAASHLGVPVSEVSHLKTTNLRETVAGEAPFVPVVNDVTRAMDVNQRVTGFQNAGVEHSGAVQSGPFPNAGAHAMQGIRKLHSSLAGFDALSDRPSNETLQPGYRRRA